MTLELTEEQQAAIEKIEAWLNSGNPSFRLGGYAGTGKTTLISYLESGIMKPAICAFTGKAVNVLRQKGLTSAQTVHSTVYHSTKASGRWVTTLKNPTEVPGDFFIVDEASMLSTELYNDIMSFGRPVLFVGDPGQLEPVGSNPNLMRNADLVLTQIHRQALESPILQFAHWLRGGNEPPPNLSAEGLSIRRKRFSDEELLAVDQIICARNKTRSSLNTRIRTLLKRKGLVSPGERMIVLKNNADLGVFNGMALRVEKVHTANDWAVVVDATGDAGEAFPKLTIWSRSIIERVDPKDRCPEDFIQATYGYAITCHKSQGSEWGSVAVMDEASGQGLWDDRRWRYTAVTRAKNHLNYWW